MMVKAWPAAGSPFRYQVVASASGCLGAAPVLQALGAQVQQRVGAWSRMIELEEFCSCGFAAVTGTG